MDNELTNLLPPERQSALSREYLLRLGVVVAVMITALTFAAALLLVPTYIFLNQSASAKATRLASIESTLSSSEEKTLSEQLATLARDAAALVALGDIPSASGILRTALAVPHPGIALSGLAYTPAEAKVPGTLAITGIAATRDALRTYQLAVQSAPFAAEANLPVSAYAKDANITFTITVTLAP
ncbi:MAG: hypothetical protein WCT41_00890 [Candidatus Paceibacterota bacterium]|jgi:hypothetical protein